MNKHNETTALTILLPAGRLPLDVLEKVTELASNYGFTLYLSTSQNLRLLDIPSKTADLVKEELKHFGAQFKKAGAFPLPKTCIGKPHCSMAAINTEKMSDAILARFSQRTHTKGKLKIAISGCTLCCSGSKLTDIGIVAGRNGFDIYAGGKGGHSPRTGKRIRRDISEQEVLNTIEVLVNFHDQKTLKKQRLYKLLDNPDFPFLPSV